MIYDNRSCFFILKKRKYFFMKISLSKFFDQHGREVGAVLTAGVKGPRSEAVKFQIERKLLDYASKKLYPDGYSFVSTIIGFPSVTVIKNVQFLPNEPVEIPGLEALCD